MTKICKICKKEYEKGKFCSLNNWRKSRFCSWGCKAIGIGIEKIGEKHFAWKGGEATRKQRRVFYEMRRKYRKIGNGGCHTFGEWENLKVQYNWTCPSCGGKEPEIKLTQDHIIPIIKGGSDNIENIQPLCGKCNSIKATLIIKY